MLHNNLYNRDNMVHCITNWHNCGLPQDLTREIVEGFFGEGCWDPPPAVGRTPINDSKITLARWAFLHKQWHDMATLCDWIWPMTMSPSKERGYRGDIDLEGKFMTVVTGENWDTAKVQEASERVSAMLRVMTAISFNIYYGSTSLREDHDKINDHWFDRQPELQPFEPGATKLCREDWAKSQDMFYERMGWDVETGIPTRTTLERLGLEDMAQALEERGLLPN
jgi:aldehyde:ferredoxin oxidoreductase